MDISLPGLIAVFFALLVAALVAALIFRRDFRDAVLGGPGEASILGLITVKGAAIVLLFGILIGGILFALNKLPVALPLPNLRADGHTGPITVRLNVHFEPDEVNPRNPKFSIKAFLKTREGDKPIAIVPKLSEGALSVRLDVPDMDMPYFIVFETPKGIWKTDDHSNEVATTARKQLLE